MAPLPRLGAGRAALVLSPGGSAALSATLAGAGLTVEDAAAERDALDALARGAFAAIYVSQSVGVPALQRLVAAAAQRPGAAQVVVLGTSGSVQEAVDAMQLGASDYLPPPYDADAVLRRLAAALERMDPPEVLPTGLLGVIGTSPAMRKLYRSIEKIARYKSNILLLGESGTGKEIIARALHARGPRRQHQFVPVNCATLGRDILENELFGHERGAFTGANERKKGLFELADGGTFFLDEIAEMDLSTQAKLLRVLERSEFRRVGGTGKVKVDLSIVAATNRDLEEAIAAGRFREDLYYRLKVVTLVVPPLRERREDVPALVDAFIADFNRRTGGRIGGIEPQALARLVEREWPGNVRELRNAVEGACVLASGDLVRAEDLEDGPAPLARIARSLPPPLPDPAPAQEEDSPIPIAGSVSIPIGCTLAEAERRIVLANLRHFGTRARTARALGVGLRTLYTKLAAWSRDDEDAGSA
jgi:DNA-binding NtrC family response regulator